ncbi:MAG: thioredoxin family protein [Chitinophagaceae bacterium]|nr:thioredoxin family protein [Polaromonas sp.]
MNFRHILYAIILIAYYSVFNGAIAQNNLKSQPVPSAVVTTDQVRAELLAWVPEGVERGKPIWVGLQLTHQPEWHTYWKNSGDSGLPTLLEWQLPEGITAGDIAWPTPKKISIGTLVNYGYEGAVLLPVPLMLSPAFLPAFGKSQLDIKLKASWLVCRKECIPQEGEFLLSIPFKSSTALSSGLFQAAFDAAPKPLPVGTSQINVNVNGNMLKVSLAGLPAALQGKTLALFPETSSVIDPSAPWQQAWQGALWTAQLPLSSQRAESPALMPLVVSAQNAAYRIDVPVRGVWPAVTAVAEVSPALQAALNANANANANVGLNESTSSAAGSNAVPLSLMAALLGALLGGMILNLMPCVFPVLAIKVVGFVKVKDRSTRVRTGLSYSAGVVLSFLALGALLLVLRAAGEQLGWGFQLQSPAVVATLAVLFTLMGLNLAGVFEFGNFLPARVANLQAKNPSIDSFLSGVLATAIASPCTAPFMGASLGYAVGLPAWQALAVFGAIGVGMAIPFLVASLVPAVARALPRPGAWMVSFKQLMAFPMFATTAWLIWVLGQQSGIDGVGALLGLLVLLALVLWSLGLQGRSRWLVASVSIALTAVAVFSFGHNITQPIPPLETSATSASGASGVSADSSSSVKWQAWEPGSVGQLTTQGQSVFVDFTAAWCVTCQYNKKVTLSNALVLSDLSAKKVALLRADWTRRDPAVTAALAQLGRSGVPVYVIYKPGQTPVVLSEILTVDEVRAELAKL